MKWLEKYQGIKLEGNDVYIDGAKIFTYNLNDKVFVDDKNNRFTKQELEEVLDDLLK